MAFVKSDVFININIFMHGNALIIYHLRLMFLDKATFCAFMEMGICVKFRIDGWIILVYFAIHPFGPFVVAFIGCEYGYGHDTEQHNYCKQACQYFFELIHFHSPFVIL